MPSSPFFVGLDADGAGAHPAAAAVARLAGTDLVSGTRLARTVRQAENAGLTFVSFTDALLPAVPGSPASARLDSVTRAAFVSRTTTAIGLVPQVPTTYPEPFHVAAQLASLDIAAAGRGGWIPSVTRDAATADAYGRAVVGDVAREARDVVQVVRDLWDSWEDDAVIRDVATGRYIDRERLHYVDFRGETFSVKGPLITPRPPQGQLVVLASDGDVAPVLDPAGGAGPLVDVTLVGGSGAATARGNAVAAREHSPLTGIDIEVVLDAGGRTGADRLAVLDASTPAGVRSPWDTSALRHVGSAAGLVALLTELATPGPDGRRPVDGVRLLPAVLDVDLPVLARDVLPALRAARLTAVPRPGASLRESLGLPRPANRYDTRVQADALSA
ncbi:luciferase-like monooxygenase [Promicromonospora sp. AC04]|uniref:LLM class flavin-dependent oxidoreductase n=1 Tax=Promicromonospora sp. AC04 TaxID=2135723 RepID=UPI000D335DD8|nr:LLM class flavin-dependent oxidoreductase [Promicromonospora sp. AC04]PUB31544.1 luciferase-like monooxygenase [Promicromonospora sp. AC04]